MPATDNLALPDNALMTIDHIGRYEIKGRLGRGGMATVYRGYDPRFGREVAVKVLPLDMVDDAQFRARFEREAHAIAALEHPCIVPVYDFAEDNGQPFIVMRLMKGGSLAERLKEGALSLVDASRILERIAQALDAAHQRGIIHRDLKPGNILFDEYDNAYLSDFGIAHIAGAGSTLTGTGVIGTPAYMSPEQVQGSGAPLDARSDVYALGIILYQMLSGQTPFQADTPARVMMAHILEQPEPILDRRPDLPPECDAIFGKALAKDPEERFDSAGELAAAFKALVLSEAPTPQSRPTAPTYEAPTRTARSHPASPSIPSPPITPPAAPLSEGAPRRGGIPLWIFALAGVLLLGGAAGGGFLLKGLLLPGGAAPTPAAAASAASLQATQTALVSASLPDATATSSPSPAPGPTRTPSPSPAETALPTDTPVPTDTPAPTATPAPIVLGGADRISFLRDSDIWTVNLDGSDLRQLTKDGGEKTLLQWMPDGKAVTYILGKCVHSVEDATGRDELIMCLKAIDTLSDFTISPNGSQVAISVDNQLYVVPFDRDALAQVEYRTDLQRLATCKTLAPYTRNAVKQARWSDDASMLALKLIGNDGTGRQVDLVDVVSIAGCPDTPPRKDEFPAQRFTIKTYDTTPIIQNFSWDGVYLFALTGFVRNDGFGDLYIYNSDLHRADVEVNPVGGVCCYRDPQFSPNGQYLAFAFQDIRAGAANPITLYYIDISTLGTGVRYTPIPLPEGFFSNPREKPQPVLRPH